MPSLRWSLLVGFVIAAAIGLGTVMVFAEPTRETLETDIQQIDDQIAAAEADAAKYAGGAILQAIQMRIETLKATRAMLDQKRLSWLRLIDLSYTIDGHIQAPASADELAQMQSEIERTQSEIARNEAELSAYSGGLVQVVLMLTVATQKLTLAFLDLRYLTAKWAIPLYLPESASAAPAQSPGKVVEDKDAL